MATGKRKASEENPKKTNTDFLWTDDEIQFLLKLHSISNRNASLRGEVWNW